MKRKVITSICVGALLATGILSGMAFSEEIDRPSAEAHQEHMKMKHERDFEIMAEILTLSGTQQELMRAIHEQERISTEATRRLLREGHEQMRVLLESDSFNEAAIRSLAKSLESLQAELFVSRAKAKHEEFQLLTYEQQELAKKLKPLLHKNKKP